MKYGQELIKQLEAEIQRNKEAIDSRNNRIKEGLTDIDDCFISQRCEERGICNSINKISLIQNGGCAWFTEYATLDNQLIDAHWCNTYYGSKLKVTFPDGSVKWTTAQTPKGLAKLGIKKVNCLRPAWYRFSCGNQSGMLGVYTGDYVLFPSDINYATGELASDEPLEIIDI